MRDKGHELIRKYAAAEVGSDAVVCGQKTEAWESTSFSASDILLEAQARMDTLPDVCVCHHI